MEVLAEVLRFLGDVPGVVVRARKYATLTATEDGSAVAFVSSYDAGLVAALKARVPPTERRWDPDGRRWLVSPGYADVCAEIAAQHLGVAVPPPILSDTAQSEVRTVKLEYLGAPKDRGGDEATAFGYADGGWSLVFPLSVLRAWFDPAPDGATPDEAPTLYGVLGVPRDADSDIIRRAYRKAALTWHPDHNRDVGAAAQFRRIREAYEVLHDPTMRRKYDAGLALVAGAGKSFKQQLASLVWQPPLRCGYLMVEGVPVVGRFNVGKILAWEEIKDARGRVMVTAWPGGADFFTVRWL